MSGGFRQESGAAKESEMDVQTLQCDGSCHDSEYGIRACPGCDTGVWALMCPDCQFYAAQDL